MELVAYKARPIAGASAILFLGFSWFLVFFLRPNADAASSSWIILGSYTLVILWYARNDFRTPAATVCDGELVLLSSSWRGGRAFTLNEVQRVQVWPKHVGITEKGGACVAVTLTRFTMSSRAKFLSDPEAFSSTGLWPSRAA